MKSAYVVSADPGFWTSATGLLGGLGAIVTNDTIQLRAPDGRLFTIFRAPDQAAEALAEPVVAGPGLDRLPDLANVEVYAVECRWEPMFAEVLHAIGQAVPGTWVVDGSGVVWDSTRVDPAKVQL